jgi:hypothetical protein
MKTIDKESIKRISCAVGSAASIEPWYSRAKAVDWPNESDWDNLEAQSIAVNATGLVWKKAIAACMIDESTCVSTCTINGVVATQYYPTDGPIPEQNLKAIELLDEWLSDDSGYDEETWPLLKNALENNRLSNRSLFND